MSGKDFFVNRYSELGWEYKPVQPRQAIRMNTMTAGAAQTIGRLESRGVQLERIPFLKDGYWVLVADFSVGATTEYLLGLYSIQEAAPQIPVGLFSELEQKLVFDACAAPGGKTVQLADLMKNTGAIIAFDIDKRRLTAMSNQLERCRVANTIIYQCDARQASRLNLKFDRVLLDMPCSGNFAIDRQWFSKRTMKDVERNAQLQREILTGAEKALKSDGEIVYSTCSLEPEEGELNVDWAVENLGLRVEEVNCYGQKGLTNVFGRDLHPSVENCRRIWPGQTQGFFVCKLKRRVNRDCK